MGVKEIVIDDNEVLIQKYKVRLAGRSTIEVTIPPVAFEREMRRLGVDPNKAHKEVDAIWRFNSFHGLHLSFKERNEI